MTTYTESVLEGYIDRIYSDDSIITNISQVFFKSENERVNFFIFPVYYFLYRKGYYFSVDLYYKEADGSLSPATPLEIQLVLEQIIATADSECHSLSGLCTTN